MRWSETLIPTRKEDPANARSKAERLLLRAGFIQLVAGGNWTWLPLGSRVLRKLLGLVCRTLEELKSEEIASPLDVPGLAASIIHQTESYRDLPLALHRVGSGQGNRIVIDAITYQHGGGGSCSFEPIANRMVKLLELLRPRPFPVGDAKPEMAWVSASDDGDTKVLISDKGNYSALEELAETLEREWSFAGPADLELESIHTPGETSVTEVSALLNGKPSDVLKTLVFQTITSGPAQNSGINPNWVVAVVRGDHEINFRKLAHIARENFSIGLRPLAVTPELGEKFAVGFVGPDAAMRYWDTVLIVDPDAAHDHPWIAGANTVDYHVRNFNWFRECGDKLADPKKTVVANIRAVKREILRRGKMEESSPPSAHGCSWKGAASTLPYRASEGSQTTWKR